MSRAVSGIPLLLEEARAYAMARNTYVWIGFCEEAGTSAGTRTGTSRLIVGLVAGTVGQSDDLDTGSVVPIAKLQTYGHFSLRTIDGLTGVAANGDDIGASEFGTFRQTSGKTSVVFSKVLRYSPQGEAAIKSSGGNSHWIQIGLQPMRGDGASDPDAAVFQVATLTGQVEVFRR